MRHEHDYLNMMRKSERLVHNLDFERSKIGMRKTVSEIEEEKNTHKTKQ